MRTLKLILGGLLGGILWLVIMQEGPERGWSEHDYNQMIGQLLVDRSGERLDLETPLLPRPAPK